MGRLRNDCEWFIARVAWACAGLAGAAWQNLIFDNMNVQQGWARRPFPPERASTWPFPSYSAAYNASCVAVPLQFHLEVEEVEGLAQQVEPWKKGDISTPMVIEVRCSEHARLRPAGVAEGTCASFASSRMP